MRPYGCREDRRNGSIEAALHMLRARGAPLTGAILGVLGYRIYNVWLSLVPLSSPGHAPNDQPDKPPTDGKKVAAKP
jgi:hypothetical protein